MTCPNCGNNVEGNAKFCNNCGTVLAPEASQAAAPAGTTGGYYGQTYSQPSYSQPSYAPPAYTPPPSYAPPQPSYAPPVYGPSAPNTAPLTVGNYIVMALITAIPLVGIIMLFVWAFGSDVNLNKKNWARAALIMALIGVVIWILFAVLFASVFSSILNGYYYY